MQRISRSKSIGEFVLIVLHKQTTTEILDLRDSLASQYKSYSPGAIREEPFFLQKTCRLLFLFTRCCRFTYTLLFLLWDHPFDVFYYYRILRTHMCTNPCKLGRVVCSQIKKHHKMTSKCQKTDICKSLGVRCY